MIQSRVAKAVTHATLPATLAACGLPRSGPNKSEIFKGSVLQQGNAFVVSVTPQVTRATAVAASSGFSAGFLNAGVIGADTINPGDTLSLTVFENVRDDPLLGNPAERVSVLSQVQVDGQGFIFVPYAGRVMAAGQTPEGLRQMISRELDAQTPDPQVSVQRVAGDGATVSVEGATGLNGVYPIERSTRTLSAMLARAGGVTIEPDVAVVRVTRGSQSGTVWLQDLYANPNLDIALRNGDKVVVECDTRAFVALGATGSQSRVPFESQDLSAV